MPEQTDVFVERKIDRAVKLLSKKVPFDEFPDDLKESMERWRIAHEIRCQHMYKGDFFIRQVYKTRFPKLNDTTIRQDLRCSEYFFRKAASGSREYDRIIHMEFLKMAQYRAYENGNDKEAAMYAKLYQNYLDPKFDVLEQPDYVELAKAMNITVEFNPELLGVDRMNEEDKRALWDKVQSKINIDIADADYEEEPFSVKQVEEDNE